eukprot:COSAG06_NODE_255_length_19038_cov_16.597381_3_plen_58_part_00
MSWVLRRSFSSASISSSNGKHELPKRIFTSANITSWNWNVLRKQTRGATWLLDKLTG